MPKVGRPSEKDRVKVWMGRIDAGSKAFDAWSDKFDCESLEGWYDGTGHWTQAEDPHGVKYKQNRIFAAIRARIPSMLFYRPKTRVIPRPSRSDDPDTMIDERSRLLEDTGDTFIADEKVGCMESWEEAIQDAHLLFGIVEVGYTADWIDNPNAGKPALTDDPENQHGEEKVPGKIIKPGTQERMYVKHIPADTFRVPFNARPRLDQNDWCGYYEWQRLEDVKSNPSYENTANLKPTGQVKREYMTTTSNEDERRDGMVKVWKIWDHRAYLKRVIAEGHDKFLQEVSYKYLPFADLRFHKRRKEFYPIPVIFNWIPPQREYNDEREDMAIYRKSTFPRYTYVDGAIDAEELAKLENGGAFGVAKANREHPLQEVPRAEGRLAALRGMLGDTKDDFNEISAVPGEHKGVAEAGTATQANIIDINAHVTETDDREKVGKFIAKTIKLLLLIAKEKMTRRFWVQMHVDPLGPNKLQETLRVLNGWAMVTHKELGDFDWDVSVDVEALSPATEDLRRNQWLNFIGLMGTPGALPVLASETLLRKTAAYFGIRSAKEIAEIRTSVLQAIQVQTAMQMQAKGGGGASAPASPDMAPAPGPVPGPEQMDAQMQGQMGPVQ